MFSEIINCIKGVYTIKASGRFPERVLNTAVTNGVYVQNVHKNEETLIFTVSKKGYEKLLECTPDAIELFPVKSYGLPFFFKRYRKRILLFMLPALFISSAFVFSSFIWKINITGGNAKLRALVREELQNNGIYIGAKKHKIDQYEVKRNSILAIDDLSWLWVDIKGTTADVRIVPRTKVPKLEKINEPADVIATETGVIEEMRVFCGIPLVSEGTTIEKGETLITGIFENENENIPIYYHRARGDVTARVWKEKTVFISQSERKKTPTGNKKSVYSVNFKKNNVKFSLNSGISYREYDKIEKKIKLPFVPVTFMRTDFLEVTVKEEPRDIDGEIKKIQKAFSDKVKKEALELVDIDIKKEDEEGGVKVTFTAECIMRIDKEIPINKNPAR